MLLLLLHFLVACFVAIAIIVSDPPVTMPMQRVFMVLVIFALASIWEISLPILAVVLL